MVSSKFLGVVAAKFTAFAATILVAITACGGEGISRPSVEKPLVSKDLSDSGHLVLKVQSQDNETIIQRCFH